MCDFVTTHRFGTIFGIVRLHLLKDMKRALQFVAFGLLLLNFNYSSGQNSTQEKLSIKAFSPFYPSKQKVLRISEQNIRTNMVQMGQSVEMEAVSTTTSSQRILQPKGDSQSIFLKPYKIEGYIMTNGQKQDISQEDNETELEYIIDAKGNLVNIKGNEDYIKAMKASGINNAQTGLNLMVFFKHDKELFLNDSFQMIHDGKPYSFKKTYTLTQFESEFAIFKTHTQILLDHNYDMNNYDIHQHVEGHSDGFIKVRLSDYLITYQEENLDLAGYMEMVSVNIPLTIKGSMKETIEFN